MLLQLESWLFQEEGNSPKVLRYNYTKSAMARFYLDIKCQKLVISSDNM